MPSAYCSVWHDVLVSLPCVKVEKAVLAASCPFKSSLISSVLPGNAENKNGYSKACMVSNGVDEVAGSGSGVVSIPR